jgi:1-acyl-sn-glycerol-3-phosphate acyltransferase
MTSDRGRVPLRVANPHPVQPVYRRVARFGGWLLRRLVDRDWDDAVNLPADGGVIVVSNHISNVDPLCLGQYLIWNGRWPRALIKADVWSIPVLGRLARATGQIPVERGTQRAEDALARAQEALSAGECVLIYPEGTITADPDTWPMTPHPGAARLALATGAPVIPVGQWGAQAVMPGKKLTWPRVLPRRTVSFRAGPAVDLSDLVGSERPADVQAAARRMMVAVTALVAELRGEPAPAEVYDLRLGRRVAGGVIE